MEVTSHPSGINQEEKPLGTHWTRGWEDPTGIVDTVENGITAMYFNNLSGAVF
jgi:hypothetical protein